MSERKFEGILEYLCGDIISKAEQREVRDELYDHLMSVFETNLACGMSEDEAEENAVDHLGDTLALKKDLNRIHQNNPLGLMVNSLLTIPLSSYFLLFLAIDPFNGLQDRFLFIALAGVVGIIVWGAVNVRKISRGFRLLSVLSIIFTLTAILHFSLDITAYFPFHTTILPLFLENVLITITFHISVWNLLKSNNLRLKNNFLLILAAFGTVAWSALCVYVFYFVSKESEIYDNSYFLLFFPVFIIQSIFIKSVSKTIIKNELKIKLEDSLTKKAAAAIIATVIFISAGLVDECVCFYQSNDKVISGLTLNYDSKERKSIENILSEYKVSAEQLALLPDSEIFEYKELIAPENNSLINDYFNVKDDNGIIFGDLKYEPKDGSNQFIRLDSDEYAFPLRKEGNDVLYRVLRITDYTMADEDFKHFSNSIAGSFDHSSWRGHSTSHGNNITVCPKSEIIMLADDENGKITYREPLRKIKGPNGEVSGCEFRIKRKTHLIIAFNVIVEDGLGHNIYSSIGYSFKRKPITLKYRSAWSINDGHADYKNVSNDSISATSEFYTHEKTNKEYVEYLNEKYNS